MNKTKFSTVVFHSPFEGELFATQQFLTAKWIIMPASNSAAM